MEVNKQKETLLSSERLKELLDYNPETGIFTWLKKTHPNSSKIKVGNIAGCLHKVKGYVFIWIDNKYYQAHRLAWLYQYGEFPNKFIDHINGIKNDNRISNLRNVSNRTNMENKPKYMRLNTTLPTGVKELFRKSDGSLFAYIAYWRDIHGEPRWSPYFNILKCGGGEQALSLAMAYREARIMERIAEGAAYSLRHGLCT